MGKNHLIILAIMQQGLSSRQNEREGVISLVKNRDVTIIDTQGTILGEYIINPEMTYQAKK